MERVTFLVERSGDRISCLLNPESLEARRTAGVARRRDAGGVILGNPRSDDPLLSTGGGVTEYDIYLLFDVDVANEGRQTEAPSALPSPPAPATIEGEAVAGPAALEEEADTDAADGATNDTSTDDAPATPAIAPELPIAAPPRPMDVRSLTQPLWALAENGEPVDGEMAPQRVRFIWGRSWNVPGVILAVAERLERFDAQGVPQRSWLSLRLRRVEESSSSGNAPPPPATPQFESDPGSARGGDLDETIVPVPVDSDGLALDRLDQIAADQYGDPALRRAIADYNDLDDMLHFAEGDRLRLPPRAALLAAA